MPMCLVHSSTLQNVSDREQYCCLLFDEMLVRKNVHFNQKLDCIEGFEDCGTERTCNIANHALVFVVVCIESGSSQLLTTSAMEELRLTC